MDILVLADVIDTHILMLQNQKVILSSDLAELSGIEQTVLAQAIEHNTRRFSENFMSQLAQDENKPLRSQNMLLQKGHWQHTKFPTHTFTEQGIATLSSTYNRYRANSGDLKTWFKRSEQLKVLNGWNTLKDIRLCGPPTLYCSPQKRIVFK